MADFCHDFDPGGLGGNVPLGDFQWAVAALKDGTLEPILPGYVMILGICEGHGGYARLERDDQGVLWFNCEAYNGPSIEVKE